MNRPGFPGDLIGWEITGVVGRPSMYSLEVRVAGCGVGVGASGGGIVVSGRRSV